MIQESPFFHLPIPNVTLKLATNASKHSIDAILYQTVDNEKKFLSFHSKALKDRYSILKKELFSILFHIKFY